MSFLGVREKRAGAAAGPARADQALGEHCGGRDLAECRALFGEGVARVCSTCPD